MRTIINCSLNTDASWRWLDGQVNETRILNFDLQQRGLMERGLSSIRMARHWTGLRAARAARCADLLVSHLPSMTAITESLCFRRRAQHVAFAFNFTRLPQGAHKAFYRTALSSVDRFVVASRMEQALYSDYFRIDRNRFDFKFWTGSPPPVDRGDALVKGDYLCAIGGEARDYSTLVEAMRLLPHIEAVLVARPSNLTDLEIPANVRIMTNAPLVSAMNVLRHSRFMVLPLESSLARCGHVTLVAAMFAAKGIILTRSLGTADYIEEDVNAVSVPPVDADALADRIQALWNAPARAKELGDKAREFAHKHCSSNATAEYLQSLLPS